MKINKKNILFLALTAVVFLSMASVGAAAVTKVICVPWEGNILADHQTWDGKVILLKAVVHADNTAAMSYAWNFGDGSANITGSLSGSTKYNVDIFHAYSGTVGTPFIATLTVNDGSNEISDIYRVRIKNFNLDTERAVAVDDALWWLYKQQYADGHWASYGSYYASPTASAVHAFEVNNHLEIGNPNEDPYVETVSKGLAYIFTRLGAATIGAQTYGDPDTNGNMLGIQVTGSRPIYEGGMVMDAIINSRTPGAIAATGPVNVIGRTYKDIIQDMCDMYAWGQGDAASGINAGGWRYSWNVQGDNSACQWAAIGMIPAERTWGCTVPQWVKDRNDVWLGYSYRDYGSYSGFGYTGQGAGTATTPSGMVQLSFCGKDTSDYRWIGCEDYFVIYWNSWNNSYDYYGYYAGFKAFSLALPTPVETLYNGFDWYRGDATTWGLAKRLIEDQDRNVSSSSTRGRFRDYYGRVFATAWATIILSGFEAQPVAVVTADPNPTGQDVPVTFDHSASYHLDPNHNLTLFEYDFDDDGTYDWSSTDINAKPTYTFHCDTYPTPCTFIVTLRVTDDSSPVKRDTETIDIEVTPPPHAPTAVTGGPYTVCPGGTITLDGSESFDIDEPEGDHIASWDWEIDLLVPYDYDDATGETVEMTWATPGIYDIALKVTDSNGLTNVAWTTVHVDNQYCVTCVDDLTARAKRGKVQLVWTHVDADRYDIYRSDDGGTIYNKIAETTSTYSTYLDSTVTSGNTYFYYVKSVFAGDDCDSDPVQILVPTGR
ncbi:MAG: hypothetical protein JW786_03725 [Desulfobacterales bacterium]|nr:hypothetical protein [Desulfobacterales bacterium]